MRASIDDCDITRLNTIDMVAFAGKPVPEREWLIEGWIPWRSTTIVYGDGGTGKSLLAQQLMTCVAAEKPFLGLHVRPCKTYGFFCEDDVGELHRRQDAINRKLNIEFGDLENFKCASRVGEDNILMKFAANGDGELTPLFEQLINEVLSCGAQVVVVDTAADTFGGNEISRPQVRQFLSRLTRLAQQIDGVVIVLAHPSQSGMSSGSGGGGSTAWSNSARSRLYLEIPEPESGGTVERNARVLTRKKSNYATIGDEIALKYVDGCFEAEGEHSNNDMVSRIEKVSREVACEDIFLSALDRLTIQKRNCTSNSKQSHYAPKIMKTISITDGYKHRELELAMFRLIDKDIVRLEPYKDKGREYHRLVRARDGGKNAD